MIFLNLSINPVFTSFLLIFFYNLISYSYIRMSKYLSAKIYQENNERLQKKNKKKLVIDIKIFLMKKKRKRDNVAVNVTGNFKRWKTKAYWV